MKAYSYILLKSFASVLGVFLVITLIDLAFNFFSQLEDIGATYSYTDAVKFLLQTQPFRSREFIYLCSVVGLLLLFTDKNFMQSFNTLRQSGLKKYKFAIYAFLPIVAINLTAFEFIVPDLTVKSFEERKQKINQVVKEKPQMIEIININDKEYSVVYGAGTIKFSEDGEVLFNQDQNSSFSEINYNSNLKYLSFSQLIENSDSAFENFNLIVKTELLKNLELLTKLSGIDVLVSGLIFALKTSSILSISDSVVVSSNEMPTKPSPKSRKFNFIASDFSFHPDALKQIVSKNLLLFISYPEWTKEEANWFVK